MDAHRPLGLLAELTYRCPLACPYCSNPVDLDAYAAELETAQWLDVLDQAGDLGVLQVHLSGGEPLARRDLAAIARHASGLGLYANLVTSGVGLTSAVAERLAAAGLDHVQLSVQAATPAESDAIAGSRSFGRKMAAAAAVRAAGMPLTLNVVLHRTNIGSIPSLVDLAVRLGAQRLELANVQYYGWALANRAALLPTVAQVAAADRAVREARATARNLEIIYVAADYFTGFPKPCMYGWGRRQLVIAPDGTVLPCLAAAAIPGLGAWNVRDHTLASAWHDSPAVTKFRGFDWMKEPCASCSRRTEDFGGCRCQAYLLTGDAAAADPACRLSPSHPVVRDAPRRLARGAAGHTNRPWPAHRPHAPSTDRPHLPTSDRPPA